MHIRNVLLAGLTLLAACLAAAPGRAADLAYFENQLKPFVQKPIFTAPGPPINARQCMKGKTIFSIPGSSANPFSNTVERSIVDTAAKIGFKVTTWENQGQTSQWVQGMEVALTQKPSLIDLVTGTDPRVMVPQVRAAAAAGIPVVASHFNGLEESAQMHEMGVGVVPFDFATAGALLIDWAALHTKGKLNALVIIATGVLSTDSMITGINRELKQCPECKIRIINVPVTDWSTRITPNVQAALLSDPSINYIIPIYDSMSQFVMPAITLTNSANRVKIATFNGTPFVLGLLQEGKVEMDIGENLDWIGHAVLDSEMRMLCHLPAVQNPHIPMYIFDSHNADDAGKPPQLSKGYGNAYLEGYATLWELR
jgi:ribose transport system substrate-binding protein